MPVEQETFFQDINHTLHALADADLMAGQLVSRYFETSRPRRIRAKGKHQFVS